MKNTERKPIAVIGTDSHLKKDNEELVYSCFNQTKQLLDNLKIKTFFHGGDFFTSRNAQPEDSLRKAKEIFQLFDGYDYYQIPGNHDKTKLDSENSYLDVFDKYCTLIKGYDYVDLEGVRVHLIPYFKEDVNYSIYLQKTVENIDKSVKNILLTHIAITGVRNNDGSEVENTITPKIFKVFDSVIVGHYHNRSIIGDNIHYIGSMYSGNYGEDNNKGLTVLFSDGSHKHYQLDFPHYLKIEVDVSDKESLREVEEEYKDTLHNIRLILKGEKGKLESIDKSELEEKGFNVKFEDSSIIASKDLSKGELIIFNRSNLKEAFEKFCISSEIKDNSKGLKYLEII